MTQTAVELPSNIYKVKTPLEAKVLETIDLCKEGSPNQVKHIVLDLKGSDMEYWDGQSIGVLPPGEDANGRPHKLRLYSIASPGYGDDGDGNTVTICVKRALSEGFPPGVCSSFLCDSNVGDVINITGPVGKHFVLPNDPDANLIMVATGTGIAPFRAFLKRRFEKWPQGKGKYWLIFGMQTQKDFLYDEELNRLAEEFPDHFKMTLAVSREMQNSEGGRMYVQHQIQENAQEVFKTLLDSKTYFYMCGLRGMEPGVMEGLNKAAESQGIVWEDFLAQLKEEHRWLVEVY